MKEISRIGLLFPVFVFLLRAPRPSYRAIAHVGTSTSTCAQALGTAASETCSPGTSTAAGSVLRKKICPGAVTRTMAWLAVFHAKLTSSPVSPGPNSVSLAIAFEAATATVFSIFINGMGAGRR
jgi:hypothetical protein